MSDKNIHIILAFNDAYAEPAKVLITYILRQTSHHVRFHILSCGLSYEACHSIQSLVNHFSNGGIDIHNNIQLVTYIPLIDSRFSQETFLRLVADSIITSTSKAIYLDVDLLIRGDISELYDYELHDALVAGVTEEQMSFNGYPQKIGIKTNGYINAGVLLMNLSAIRAERCAEKLIKTVIDNHRAFRFQDQDAINSVFAGRILYLPMKYNFNLYYYRKYKQKRTESVIVHFTGPDKPWMAKDAKRWPNRRWRRERVFQQLVRYLPVRMAVLLANCYLILDYLVGCLPVQHLAKEAIRR